MFPSGWRFGAIDKSNVLETIEMAKAAAAAAEDKLTEGAVQYMRASSTPGAEASRPVRRAPSPSLGASIPEGVGWALGLGALGVVMYVMYRGTR
jgi:hypothetical protein